MVQGKLFQYWIYFGSGIIYKGVGGVVCVILVVFFLIEEVYLFFFDVDEKIVEIFSKIFLFFDDDVIEDEDICLQIENV